MSRLAVVVAAFLAAAGCKSKDSSKEQVASKAPDAAPAQVPPSPPPQRKLLDPAGAPIAATAEICASRGGAVTTGSLRAVAAARKVPAAALDQVAKELEAAFSETCTKDSWPLFVIQCIGTSPPSAETYERCAARLPDAKRAPWEAKLDAIVGKAGGEPHPAPPVANPTGTTFEELCPTFVAEVARLDGCTGGNQYLPRIEAVFARARSAAIGGLIPPDAQGRIKTDCDEQAQVALAEASRSCSPPQ